MKQEEMRGSTNTLTSLHHEGAGMCNVDVAHHQRLKNKFKPDQRRIVFFVAMMLGDNCYGGIAARRGREATVTFYPCGFVTWMSGFFSPHSLAWNPAMDFGGLQNSDSFLLFYHWPVTDH